jgi:hypothetical protein
MVATIGAVPMRPHPAPNPDWKCANCGRFLARIERDIFTRPNGDSGRLPAVIRCKCGERNARVAWAGPASTAGP